MLSKLQRLSVAFVPALAIAVFAAQAGAAEDSEIHTLREQLRELQLRVERLEDKLQEGVPVNFARRVQPVPGGWREPSNWRLLEKGLEAHRVIEILGEPQQRRTVRKFEYLEYGDGVARLYLRRLSSWELPSEIAEAAKTEPAGN
jgi:hypothetical protein